jgi:aquaporin Z
MSEKHSVTRRLAAEFFGTFWLVLGGCGSAVLASGVPDVGIGYLGVAFAFGLTVLTMAYAVGHVSGAHFNPAVANGKAGFSASESGFATNGYGDRSPDGYSLLAVVVVEVVLTGFFLYVILGATDTRAPKGFAPLAIGLALTLIHLASIPVSNTSVNPARSTGPALFAGGDALAQLWVFWLAPLVGGLVAGASYVALFGKADDAVPLPEATEA